MISDARLRFSGIGGVALDLSQSAGTFDALANSIDTAPLFTGSSAALSNRGRNLGATNFGLSFIMTEALVGATATMRVQMYSGATSLAFTNLHIDTGVQAVTTWTLGRMLWYPFPFDSATPYLRWLSLRVVIATATTTAGLAEASLVPMADAPALFHNSVLF